MPLRWDAGVDIVCCTLNRSTAKTRKATQDPTLLLFGSVEKKPRCPNRTRAEIAPARSNPVPPPIRKRKKKGKKFSSRKKKKNKKKRSDAMCEQVMPRHHHLPLSPPSQDENPNPPRLLLHKTKLYLPAFVKLLPALRLWLCIGLITFNKFKKKKKKKKKKHRKASPYVRGRRIFFFFFFLLGGLCGFRKTERERELEFEKKKKLKQKKNKNGFLFFQFFFFQGGGRGGGFG
jgi:hypothetical protein